MTRRTQSPDQMRSGNNMAEILQNFANARRRGKLAIWPIWQKFYKLYNKQFDAKTKKLKFVSSVSFVKLFAEKKREILTLAHANWLTKTG